MPVISWSRQLYAGVSSVPLVIVEKRQAKKNAKSLPTIHCIIDWYVEKLKSGCNHTEHLKNDLQTVWRDFALGRGYVGGLIIDSNGDVPPPPTPRFKLIPFG